MKKFSFLVALLGLVVMASCGTSSKPVLSQADYAKAQAVSSKLENKAFTIIFKSAFGSMSGSVDQLKLIAKKAFQLSVAGDKVEVFLPYYGSAEQRNAYSSDYTTEDGVLDFFVPYSDYEITQNKKGNWIILFEAQTDDDSYRFRIEVTPTGEARLTVVPAQRQNMSFKGDVFLGK
jgi:hypothetical protein